MPDRRTFLHAAAAASAAQALPVALHAQDTAPASATTPRTRPDGKFLGVTVLPEYIQSEGIEGVLDNLINRVGATAVATSPYVMAEADQETGNREPPADAGAGAVRLLDRPLFGKREVWVTTAPSFVPDQPLYKGLRYQPAPATELTQKEGPIVGKFVEAARKAGLKVYFQIQAAIPPGYRVQFGGPVDEDTPRLPDGSLPGKRVSKNGTLSSPEIIGYEHALIRDLLQQYPGIHGIRFDWPEYPPYLLNSCFVDFGVHAQADAEKMGYDFERMRREVGDFYTYLHGSLKNRDLRPFTQRDGGRFALIRLLSDHPGIGDFLRFKAEIVERTVAGFRKVFDDSGAQDKEVMPNAFPPPWTLATGLDFGRVAPYSSAISAKLYTMHWMMILNFYGTQLMEANPKLDEKLLTHALVRLLDIDDGPGLDTLAAYAYPGPDQPHAAGEHAMTRKIRQAQAEAGQTPIYALAHGYGPDEDFAKRLETAWQASPHGIWINRYAYLTDRKLDLVGEVTKG